MMHKLKKVYSQQNIFGVALRVTSVAILLSLLALGWHYASHLSATSWGTIGLSLLIFGGAVFGLITMILYAQEKYKEYPKLTISISGILTAWTIGFTIYIQAVGGLDLNTHMSLLPWGVFVHLMIWFVIMMLIAFGTITVVVALGFIIVTGIGLIVLAILLIIGCINWISKGETGMEDKQR